MTSPDTNLMWTRFIKTQILTSSWHTSSHPPHLSPTNPLHLLVTLVYVVLSSRLHRRAPMLDFYFDHSEERPLEAFEDIFASYDYKK